MRRLTLGFSLLLALGAHGAERPKLGVLIVIDQLSAAAFDQRLPKTTGGIARLVREGNHVRELRYEYAPTVTSAGHATLSTGAWPQTHGVVSNEWYDEAAGKVLYSTEDTRYRIVGREPAKRDCTSPWALKAPTLGDAVRWNDGRSHVFGVAPKERSAMLLAGRSADAVAWIDSERPFFTTSTFYAKALYAWLDPLNQQLAKAIAGQLVPGLPQGGITGKNPPLPSQRTDGGHSMNEELPWQPIFEKMEVDAALAGVKALGLGRDDAPDLLVMSFSSHDVYGHHFGPDAAESEAAFLRIDAQIGRLLDGLDAQVGKGKYVVALVADHGGGKLPEDLLARGFDAGRTDGKALAARLEAEADAALGPGDWFVGYVTPGVFARPAMRAKLHTIDDRLRTVARQVDGVADLLPLPGLMENPDRYGPFGAFFRRAAMPGRSPDYLLLTRPYWQYGTHDKVAHGTPYLYDRSVPAVFFGAGVKKGETSYAEAVDVAPTLARLLGVPPPAACEGRAIDLGR